MSRRLIRNDCTLVTKLRPTSVFMSLKLEGRKELDQVGAKWGPSGVELSTYLADQAIEAQECSRQC